MNHPTQALQELDDLRARYDEVREENKALKHELNNAELRLTQLMESKGLPVKDEDVIKPNC